MAHILDHLAAHRYGHAADLAAQRYTALEAMMDGMPWNRAKFLELIGDEDSSLVGQHELALVANEASKEQKIGSGLAPRPAWWGQGAKSWQKGNGRKGNPFQDQGRDYGAEGQSYEPAPADAPWSSKSGKGKSKKDKGGKSKGKGKWT